MLRDNKSCRNYDADLTGNKDPEDLNQNKSV